MIECPDCHHLNIPGLVECEECHGELITQEGRKDDRFQRAILQDAIRQLNPEMPATVNKGVTVAAALDLLRQANRGYVLVMDGKKLAGILTERDAMLRVFGVIKKPESTPVEHVMTPKPDALHLDDTISLVFHKMTVGGYRHVPVFDDIERDHLVGVITDKDILHYFEDYANS